MAVNRMWVDTCSSEVSNGNGETALGNQRNVILVLKFGVWMNCVLCLSVLWKVELASNGIGDLVEQISKPSIHEAACFPFECFKCKKGEMT